MFKKRRLNEATARIFEERLFEIALNEVENGHKSKDCGLRQLLTVMAR